MSEQDKLSEARDAAWRDFRSIQASDPELALELEAWSRNLAGRPWSPWATETRILLEKAARALKAEQPVPEEITELRNGLKAVIGQIRSWLDWSAKQRADNDPPLTTEDGTRIMCLPVPFWPSHGAFENWIKLFEQCHGKIGPASKDDIIDAGTKVLLHERQRCAALAESLAIIWENTARKLRAKGSFVQRSIWPPFKKTNCILPNFEAAARDADAAARGIRDAILDPILRGGKPVSAAALAELLKKDD